MEAVVQNQLANGVLVENFRDLTERVSDLLGRQGIKVMPYNQRGIDRFLNLPRSLQESIYSSLEKFYQLCEMAENDGVPFEDSGKSIIWWTLTRLGMVPSSDLMSHIQPGVSIEVYNAENVQIFRTFDILRKISYSLSEIVTYEWWELFERSSFVNQGMIQMAQDAASGKISGVHYTSFPEHEVREVMSEEKCSIRMRHLFICPLKDKAGGFAGGISVFQMLN
ncbi:MAG: hypothetical protein BroJett040_24280 [Oligoflexia bacterium]|nr:MAG: hypothetical protein BroJett040_24280 [Oligoflexia bacterium]